MSGLLTGQIADQIYAGFKGKLLVGTLKKPNLSDTLDDFGDATTNGDPLEYSCEGFIDEYTDFYRATAGIPETDVKVSIFAKSLSAGIEPDKDDTVTMNGADYKLRRINVDPATALWECQAFKL